MNDGGPDVLGTRETMVHYPGVANDVSLVQPPVSGWNPVDERLGVHDKVVRPLVVVPEDEDVLEAQDVPVVGRPERVVERRLAGEHGEVVLVLAPVAYPVEGVAAVAQVVAEFRRVTVDTVGDVVRGVRQAGDVPGVEFELVTAPSVQSEQAVGVLDVDVDELARVVTSAAASSSRRWTPGTSMSGFTSNDQHRSDGDSPGQSRTVGAYTV